MNGSAWWRDEVPESLGDGYTAAILEAIAAGDYVLDFETVVDGDFEFEICRAPLAIGEPNDFVFLLGLSAEAVDMIARALGDVMSPTPALWDIAAEDDRQVQIGPHTLPTLLGVENGAAGMTKRAAKAHADALARDDTGGLMSAAIKTYVLHPYQGGARERYACEYGWRLDGPVGWGSRNSSGSGYLVQRAEWAHLYRGFWDYSMGGIYVKTAARHGAHTVNLAELARAGATAPRVAPFGPVPYIRSPECRDAVSGVSEPPDTLPAPAARPTLSLGSKGEAVEGWQRVLVADGFSLAPYGVDGHFGKLTHNATVGWQRERGLHADGVVGPNTWEAIGDEPVERDEPDGGITSVVLCRNFTQADRQAVDVVVIHTMEAPEASTTAEAVAAWGAGADAPEASWHYAVDDDSTILCVPEESVAWAAPGANGTSRDKIQGIQIEHAGYARQSVEQWFDPFSRRMLARSAKLVAAICKRWLIPVEFVSAAELLEGKRGITTHYQVTKGPGKGRTTHTDPGRNFPMSTYLDMIREATA